MLPFSSSKFFHMLLFAMYKIHRLFPSITVTCIYVYAYTYSFLTIIYSVCKMLLVGMFPEQTIWYLTDNWCVLPSRTLFFAFSECLIPCCSCVRMRLRGFCHLLRHVYCYCSCSAQG